MSVVISGAGYPSASYVQDSNGNWVPLQSDANKNIQVSLRSSGGSEPNVWAVGNADNNGTGAAVLMTGAYDLAYNDGLAQWERRRNNVSGTLLASALRTATTVTANQTNYSARGVAVYLNVTAASGTGGLTTRIGTVDPVSGATIWMNVAPTAVTAVGLTVYELYPGTSNINGIQGSSLALPRTWYVTISHGDATNYTYSVGYSLIL